VSVPADDPGLHARAEALDGEFIQAGDGAGGEGVTGQDDFTIDIDPLELVADTLEMLGVTVAPYWFDPSLPEEIRITRAKVEKLSKGYLALGMKYIPGLIEKFPLEFSVILQTVMVIRPILRAGVPLRKPKPKPADAETETRPG
jgi:hypothetical protein